MISPISVCKTNQCLPYSRAVAAEAQKFWVGRGQKIRDYGRLPPRKLISFGPFVYCLWKILLLFFIFLSLSLLFSPIFLPPWNFRGGHPPTKILGGHIPPPLLPPMFKSTPVWYPQEDIPALPHPYLTYALSVWKSKCIVSPKIKHVLQVWKWKMCCQSETISPIKFKFDRNVPYVIQACF